jgi:histidine ammonia-lyase
LSINHWGNNMTRSVIAIINDSPLSIDGVFDSGIRPEIINRQVALLNAEVPPIVKDVGSIGASGDLVPLAHIAGATISLDPCFLVKQNGNTIDCVSALKSLGSVSPQHH